MVPGKHYFTFRRGDVFARPANRRLFLSDPLQIKSSWNEWLNNTLGIDDFVRLSYTVSLAPCLAMEIFDRQNKKGPATYFEHYIGHLFARWLGVNPTKRVMLPVQDRNVRMTMDFLLDLGAGIPKVHLPVKMSSRERVVQAWAHQRLLDAAYGDGTFRGIMVVFAETKLNSRSLEVVEICVPDQWLSYQTLLAKMDRVYYFDLPERYQTLTTQYPEVISIKSIGEIFTGSERTAVLRR